MLVDRGPPADPARDLAAKSAGQGSPERLEPIRVCHRQNGANHPGRLWRPRFDQFRDDLSELPRDRRIGNYGPIAHIPLLLEEVECELKHVDIAGFPALLCLVDQPLEGAQLDAADRGEMAGEVDPAEDRVIWAVVEDGQNS